MNWFIFQKQFAHFLTKSLFDVLRGVFDPKTFGF